MDMPLNDEAEDLIARFENNIVEHKQLEDAKKAIAALRGRSRGKANGTGSKARTLLVVGRSGAGKSTLLESYGDANAIDEAASSDLTDVRPVIRLEMPWRPTRKMVVTALLKALGYPTKKNWDIEEITERLAGLFSDMGVEIVLIDEAHHILTGKTEKGTTEVAEFLKSLLNRCGVQFVLFGLPDLEALEESAQMKRRFQPTVRLEPYRWDVSGERTEFRVVVDSMVKAMKPLKGFGLDDPFHLTRLYCATGGNVGLLSKYMSEAYRRALDASVDIIDVNLMANVYADFHKSEVAAVPLANWREKVVRQIGGMPASKNPFLAEPDDFDDLWEAMSATRLTMGENSNRRAIRPTGLTGTGTPPPRIG